VKINKYRHQFVAIEKLTNFKNPNKIIRKKVIGFKVVRWRKGEIRNRKSNQELM